jgi:hypothetical protein
MELDEFRKLYPSFQLTDKLLLKGMEMSCGARPTEALVMKWQEIRN